MSSSEPLPQNCKQVLKDLTGLTFGNVRVVERAGTYLKNKSNEATWRIQCLHCGQESIVRGGQLRSGRVTGKRCTGCKKLDQRRTNGPALIIDSGFVKEWTGMIMTAAASMLGGYASPLFQQSKNEVFSDTLLALSKFRGEIHPKAMSTFVYRVARMIAINRLKKSLNTPQLRAASDADAEGSYEFVLASLTDRVPDFQFNERSALLEQVFEQELTPEEQEFAKQYVASTEPHDNASQQRMWKLRRRLRARLAELRPEAYE